MNQFFILLYYHFLAYFEKLACTFPYFTFLRPLFHNCNTFTHLLLHSRYTFVTLLATPLLHSCYTPSYTFVTHLLHLCYTLVTHLLHSLYRICNTFVVHICNTRFTHLLHPLLDLRYTVLTLIMTFLMHPYSVAFCPCLICGILSGIRTNCTVYNIHVVSVHLKNKCNLSTVYNVHVHSTM